MVMSHTRQGERASRGEPRDRWTPDGGWPEGDEQPGGEAPRRFGAKEFAGLSTWRPLLEIILTWAVIVMIVALYLRYPSPVAFAAAFVLVASRQYALLILLHDSFHSLLHPSRRINDLLGALLVGAFCGSSFWPSRAAHLEHHRKLGEPDDPEFFLHCAAAPNEKRSPAAFTRHFLVLISGRQVLYTYFGGDTSAAGSVLKRLRDALPRMLPVVGAQALLLALFVSAGAWTAYFTLWVLPLLTLVILFNGLRAFCDHANVSDEPGAKEHRLVSYISSPLERFFLAPFHMNYHAEHHLFPYVPHYKLPALRRKIMASPNHSSLVQWRRGYLSFAREFLRAQRGTTPPVACRP